MPRTEAPDPDLHLDGRQTLAQQVARLGAGRAVAGHEQHRTVPVPAQRSVDAGLADGDAVELQVHPRLARHRVRQHAVGRARFRMHTDEERRVATGLEKLRVLRPFALHDELAVGVELVRDEGVEQVVAAGAVTVHDDDLLRSGRFRAAYRRIDLLRVEPARLVIERLVAARLPPVDDARDALDVADDVHAHGPDTLMSWTPGWRERESSSPGRRVASARLAPARSRRAARPRRARRRERAEAVAAELGGAPAVATDLTDETQVEQLFEEARATLGAVDVCAAVAGVWPSADEPVWELSLERWEATVRSNLTATFLTARAFLREVERNGHGSLVLVGSTAGRFGEAGHADYAAAKSAIQVGLLLSLKNEIVRVALNGRVNAVAPGWTYSPMTDSTLDQDVIDRVTRTMALRKVATADDIARAVVVLASDELSGHITGEVVTVAGGMEGRTLHPG